MWFVLTLALLAADIGTGTRLQKDVTSPLLCNSCDSNNKTSKLCAIGEVVHTVSCPKDRPFCATVAVAPDFSTTLTCSQGTTEACSTTTTNNTFRVTCVCTTRLCNRPFSQEFLEHLNYTNLDVSNITNFNIYTNDTVRDAESSTSAVVTSTRRVVQPRVEALKNSPTDDDEDDGEGSGSWGDERQRRPSPAQAAPSSHLPAHENSASNLFMNFFLVTPFVLLLSGIY